MSAVQLRFGVEIEVLTGSKASSHMEWALTARELGKELKDIGIPNHVIEDHRKDHDDFTEWSVQQEVTIPNQMMQNKCKYTICLGQLTDKRAGFLKGVWS